MVKCCCWLISLLAGLVVWPAPARAEPFLPSGLAYVWWTFGVAEFEDLQIDVTIHNEVDTKPGLYFQVYQGQIGDVGFYLGLQTDVYRPRQGGQGKGLIFSRWKTRREADARPVFDGWVESSGHEGDFVGVRRTYPWGKGTYRLRLTALDEDDEGVWYGFFILDRGRNREDYAGSLRFPRRAGRRPRIHDGGGTWLEVYSGATGPAQLPFWHVSVDGCYADQRRAKAKEASSDYAKVPNDIAFDGRDGSTHFRIGKGVERKHPKAKHMFAAPE
jgi:hypothetical protein